MIEINGVNNPEIASLTTATPAWPSLSSPPSASVKGVNPLISANSVAPGMYSEAPSVSGIGLAAYHLKTCSQSNAWRSDSQVNSSTATALSLDQERRKQFSLPCLLSLTTRNADKHALEYTYSMPAATPGNRHALVGCANPKLSALVVVPAWCAPADDDPVHSPLEPEAILRVSW